MKKAYFGIGEVIEHKMFGYQGVVYDADAVFMGTDEWYENVARSRPPKDQPWYHVLVDGEMDGQTAETYVAERNLMHCDGGPVDHPLVPVYFEDFQDGRYRLRNLKT